MSHELHSEAVRKCEFLSDITGLPVRYSRLFPELDGFNGNSGKPKFPFSFKLVLGDLPNRYDIALNASLVSGHTSSRWFPNVSWQLSYNNRLLYPPKGWISITGGFNQSDLKDNEKVQKFLLQELNGAVGGPDTQVAFMNYEDYTSEGLIDDKSYFANIYLAIMVNMKERGLPMAPILSKRSEIAKPMKDGDIDTVKNILDNISGFEAPGYHPQCRLHMAYESAVIMQHAQIEHRKRDPQLSIAESFKNLDIVSIEKGHESSKPNNILVVENEMHRYGEFRNKVVDVLTKDGGYKGSSVVTEFNLGDCMDLCRSGKIDFVIFDWCSPSDWEALMYQTQRDPLFNLFHGSDTQASIEFGDDGMQVTMHDGSVLDKDQLKKKSEDLDIRAKWMDMITSACRANGVTVPRHFIVRDPSEIERLGRIISLYLNR